METIYYRGISRKKTGSLLATLNCRLRPLGMRFSVATGVRRTWLATAIAHYNDYGFRTVFFTRSWKYPEKYNHNTLIIWRDFIFSWSVFARMIFDNRFPFPSENIIYFIFFFFLLSPFHSHDFTRASHKVVVWRAATDKRPEISDAKRLFCFSLVNSSVPTTILKSP